MLTPAAPDGVNQQNTQIHEKIGT